MIVGSIILAGGPSERMGQPKAGLDWGGQSMLLRAITELLDCSHPVVVVSRSPENELPPLHTECDLVFDERPGEGPLAAIETGLRALDDRCDAALVTACDMPFLDDRAFAWLCDQLGDHSGVVPVVDGKPQPMAGIYHVREIPAIHALVNGGERRAQALAELAGVHLIPEEEVRAFDPEARFCRDCDTPEEYAALRKLAGLD